MHKDANWFKEATDMPFPVDGSSAMEPAAETTAEQSLGCDATALEAVVMGTTIATQEDYERAAEVLKSVKSLQKKVKNYWEPIRVAAKNAYDNVLGKKKEMMDPLEKAEKHLKDLMTGFTVEQEKKRKAQEEAMRRIAQAEADRMLDEAARAEAAGDTAAAAAAMEEAEIMDGMAASARVTAAAPKADGVSQSKTWKITTVDPDKVPINFEGVEIRPVDQAAIMRLIKASKGTIQIPGVQYEESVQISVRA